MCLLAGRKSTFVPTNRSGTRSSQYCVAFAAQKSPVLTAPLSVQICVIMAMLSRLLHWLPALMGLVVTLALAPVSAYLAGQVGAVRKQLMQCTDDRVGLCSEVVTGALAPLLPVIRKC